MSIKTNVSTVNFNTLLILHLDIVFFIYDTQYFILFTIHNCVHIEYPSLYEFVSLSVQPLGKKMIKHVLFSYFAAHQCFPVLTVWCVYSLCILLHHCLLSVLLLSKLPSPLYSHYTCIRSFTQTENIKPFLFVKPHLRFDLVCT